MSKNIIIVILTLIVISGFFLRFFNINWDKGHIFHPDERAIIMSAVNLEYPSSLGDFLSKESSFNTNFFAYGNLPIYFLKFTADLFSFSNPSFAEYSGIYFVGRVLSVSFSTLTIILVFIYARRIFNLKIALLSSFFYAIAVFPIQNAHYFTVDTILTFFILLTLIFTNSFLKKQSYINSTLVGIFLGVSLATKISSLPIVITILITLAFAVRSKTKSNSQLVSRYSRSLLVVVFTSVIIFILSQPYTIIDFKDFIDQITYQSKMGSDPFIFPYTLQYAGKIPVIHELKNILLWGLGIPLSLLAISGFFIVCKKLLLDFKRELKLLPIVLFTLSFFIINSSYAVGWMRYLLPIYPYLAIFAAFSTIYIVKEIKNYKTKLVLVMVIIFFCTVWTVSFMQVYLNPHTKIVASQWIIRNIPPSSTLAIEHWDDQLPIYNTSNYNYEILALYDEDTKYKWQVIEKQLENSDYIILASNRLYSPLQKLTDCDALPKHRCYPITAKYYSDLFSEKLGFSKVAEFTSYPTIPILNIEINDQKADESFTVYDHPKIMIYKKNNCFITSSHIE